ncbi:hypothetical protein D3C76_1511990 [compost metagenome]
MGPFRPRPAIASPYDDRLGQSLTCSNVDLILNRMRVIVRALLSSYIHFAIIVKEQGRINAAIRNKDRIRPRTRRIRSRYIKVADPPHIRGNHIESAVMIS